MSTERTTREPAVSAGKNDAEAIRGRVREAYGDVARDDSAGCCGPSTSSAVSMGGCCGPAQDALARAIGYDASDLEVVPVGANLGLGCGNPTALADLRPGEVVLDLGAGAGFDAFLAARKVGPNGRVIGVDMTPEMLQRARRLAAQSDMAAYVEFREGLVEQLPVVDASVDVVISNCVINLVPDRKAAFREAYRVLKPGGRLAVSDILLTEPLPAELRELADLYVRCVGGAVVDEEYLGAIREAGFTDIEWTRTSAAALFPPAGDPVLSEAVAAVGAERLSAAIETVYSYKIRATKPCTPSPTS